MSEFIVTTAPGLAGLLLEEIVELGCAGEAEGDTTVRLQGEVEDAITVLLCSRIASRVMLPVRKFSARNVAMLYDQVRRIEWPKYLPEGASIAVYVHGNGKNVDYAMSFAPLKIKDAICDEMRKAGRLRPDVDRQLADIRIEALISDGRCELSLDLAGLPLHHRGYRASSGEAPLRENRAAALLRFVGYDGSQPLYDPFCGSGTILIEAALIALGRPPGVLRRPDSYALPKILPEAAASLKEAHKLMLAADRESSAEGFSIPAIIGSDTSDAVLRDARDNIRRAGLDKFIELYSGDARELVAPSACIVTNPPYGVRISDQQKAAALLADFTRQVKHACAPANLGLVVESGPLEKATGLRPSRKLTLRSGELELRFLKYDIFAGKREDRAKAHT